MLTHARGPDTFHLSDPRGRRVAVHLKAPLAGLRAQGVFRLSTSGAFRLASCKDVPAEIQQHPNATWVHLTTYGEWKGHPSGEFAFTDKEFREIARNFKRTKTPVPFKYEHPEQRGGEPLPSSGKVYDLRVDEHGLWGFTLFTDRAAEHIRAREYEYCSVVVLFDSTDRKTADEIGAELHEVGLTDNPFVDGQQPIRLPEQTRQAA